MPAEIIYDMPSETYHSLQRLSASGIKKLLVSGTDFWAQSWMNPNREEMESDALNLGTAYHVAVLEGYDTFSKRYAVKDKVDGRTKEGKAYNEQWVLDHPGAEPIKADVRDQIYASASLITATLPHFKDGKPEVTILWTDEETGVPMKSRLDWMSPGIVNDLKTFSNSNGVPPLKLIAGHIGKFGYHVQAAVYREAYYQAHGHEADFNFVFTQTGQATNIIARSFPRDLLLAQQGRDLMRQGINKFRDMFEKYGSKPWIETWGNEALQDTDFPLWMMEI